jgi:MYXO-CTERM domain-containing protein
MKPKYRFWDIAAALTLTSTILLTCSARGADAYWDIDGATAGAGGTAPAGTWSTANANWSTDSTGSSATQVWTNGDSALFSAGSNATGTFTVTNSGVTVDDITQQEGKFLISGGTLTLADTSMTIDTQTRTTGDYDIRISSTIVNSGAGASGIIKNGVGILHLGTATNTFSGGITLNAGTLAIENNAGTLGTGTLTFNGGNFVKSWGSGSTAVTATNALNVTGTTNVGVVQGNGGNLVFSGTWGAGSTSGNFRIGNTSVNGLGVLSSTIHVSGNVSAYTGTFSHNNLASGGNRLRFGVTNSGNVGLDAANAKFFTSGSTTGGNCLDLADGAYGTFKMGELAGTGGRIRAGWSSGGNTTFEVGALNTSSTFAGVIDNNVNGAGGLAALNKVGSGTLTLSGANTFTGATTINAGTLALAATGSLTSTQITTGSGATFDVSAVAAYSVASGKTLTNNGTVNGSFTVASGGTVNGSGTFNGAVTVNGALNPGNSPGSQTYAGGLTLGAASTTTMEIAGLGGVAGTDFDFIDVTGGTLTFDGTLAIVDFGAFDTSAQTGTFNLFDMVAGAGDFDTVTVDGNSLTYNVGTDDWSATVGDTTFNFAEGTGVLSVTVVPEPTAALLGGLGLLGLLRRRRVA